MHIKDARRTKVPGTWGEEVVVGTGEVDWPAFFATLRELNFAGDFVIEREAGTQRVADIRAAKEVVVKTGSLLAEPVPRARASGRGIAQTALTGRASTPCAPLEVAKTSAF